MRVVIDSNVLFSAVFRNGGTPHKAYVKAVYPPYRCLVCEQSFDELSESFVKKFPDRADDVEVFIYGALSVVEIIKVPETAHTNEAKLRDLDDAFILRAALAANADIIISGDLDFLESTIEKPTIMTAAQFVQLDNSLI